MPVVRNPFIPSGGTYRVPAGMPVRVGVVIPQKAMQALNTLHNVNPTLLQAALRAVPLPRATGGPVRKSVPGMHGLGDTATATPTATTDWLTGLSNFVTQNLPSYLNYNVTKDQIAAGQSAAATQAETQALLASHGIGVSTTGISTTTMLLVGGGLLAAVLLLKRH